MSGWKVRPWTIHTGFQVPNPLVRWKFPLLPIPTMHYIDLCSRWYLVGREEHNFFLFSHHFILFNDFASMYEVNKYVIFFLYDFHLDQMTTLIFKIHTVPKTRSHQCFYICTSMWIKKARLACWPSRGQRVSTRGESEEPLQAGEGSTLHLKPRVDLTRSPK